MRLTCSVDREIEVVDIAVLAKNFVEVVLVDVLGQALDNNLHNFQLANCRRSVPKILLRRLALVDFAGGLSLRVRLRERLSSRL